MRVIWFEFLLALRRLARRRTQNGLLLLTFAVSVALSLLSWSLFYTVHMSEPAFDPHGDYYVLTCDNSALAGSPQWTLEEMETLKAASNDFADFAEVAFYYSTFVKTPAGAFRVFGAYLSSRALQIVGAQPLLGRLFTPDDDRYGAAATALISEEMWHTRYGGSADVLGQTIAVNDYPATIVGVMPAGFRFPNDQDIWMSYGSCANNHRYPLRSALVKLRPGVAEQRAERDLGVILSTLPADTPARRRKSLPALVAYRDFYLKSDLRVSAVILLALSLLFLAVSCANAANLMIIDFWGRRPEVAASLALGIPRRAAIRSVAWQVGLIALAATALALAVLPLVGPLLFNSMKVINTPYWLVYHFAWRDVGVALLIAGVAATVTLVAPVAYLLLVDPDKVIRDHAYASRGTGRALWRRLLLTGQIALLTVLGVSAGLLLQANDQVSAKHRGYAADRVFMGKMSCLAMQFAEQQPLRDLQRFAFHRRVLDEIARRPETAAAAFADDAPAYSRAPGCSYALDPAAFAQHAELGTAYTTRVTDGFFDVLNVPFVAGAMFPRRDEPGGPDYAVITASLAERLWPGQDPVSRALYVRYRWMKPAEPPRQLTVCGVVQDFQASGPLATVNDAIYTSFHASIGSAVFLLVRDHAGIPTVKSLETAIHRAEPGEALYFPSTIKAEINLTLSSIHMTAGLTSVFAAAAVLLCAIGVYSLTVAQVLQSSRDFGIRLALGAEPRRLWRDFTRGHLITALVGVALGLVGASQLVRVLQSLLYGVDPHSPATYAGVAGAILVVAVLACVPSLFRLRRINPADCLRSL